MPTARARRQAEARAASALRPRTHTRSGGHKKKSAITVGGMKKSNNFSNITFR